MDWEKRYRDYREAVETSLGLARLYALEGDLAKTKAELDRLCDVLDVQDKKFLKG